MILKVLFKNTTQYSKLIYDEFLAFHTKIYHFSYLAYTVLVTAFLLGSLILQIKYHNFSVAILLCFGFTSFILWRFFRPIHDVSKEYNSETIQQEKSFTFQFYDNFFVIKSSQVYSKVKYYQLYRIFETTDFFYLYIDKTHSFLVSKSGFKKNNPDDFSKFIQKKCWWCYRNKSAK